jgi:hypothetical protein
MLPDNTHSQVIPAKAGIQSANLEPGSPRPPESSRGAVIYLLVTLAVLAAFVWALRPEQPNVKPAPLRPQDTACPPLEGPFTPTNLTEVPGLEELASLSKERRNRVLLRLNMEPCPCGCNTSLANCLASHARCAKCKEMAQKIIAEEQAAQPPTRPRR